MKQFASAPSITYQRMRAITPKHWNHKDLLLDEPIIIPAYRAYRTFECAE